jgi:hypothetical protein
MIGVAPGGTNQDAAIYVKPTPEPSTQEVLAGSVERVTFYTNCRKC